MTFIINNNDFIIKIKSNDQLIHLILYLLILNPRN
jgi:hypothetical protein